MAAPHIQIAGALSLEELLMIDETLKPAKATGLKAAIGIVYGESEHLNEKVLSQECIRQAAHELNHSQLVLITYFNSAKQILQAVEDTGIKALQLHGPIATAEIQKARQKVDHLFLIKSLPIAIDINPEEAQKKCLRELNVYHQDVDAFITDTQTTVGNELRFGATGQTHPWSISKAIIDKSPIPVIIAGGLNPENLEAAIVATSPYGVDVHSGVEDKLDGIEPAMRRKSPEALSRFIDIACRHLKPVARAY